MSRSVNKALLFTVLTIVASWLLAAVFYALGGRLDSPAAYLMLTAYMFVPMTVAIVVHRVIHKEPLMEPLGISFRLNRWFLVAWLLPPVIAFATIGTSVLLPGIEYAPDMSGLLERYAAALPPAEVELLRSQFEALPIHFVWISLAAGLVAGVTINAVAAFGEELGWRGLLQREFSHLGFWRSSAVIGVIWGIWHAPIIIQGYNYPEHPVAGVFMMIVWTLLLAPIFSYVRLRAKSVIAAAVIHGTLNATAGLSLLMVRGGSDLTAGPTGLAGFIALAAVNLGIFVYDRVLAKEPITRA